MIASLVQLVIIVVWHNSNLCNSLQEMSRLNICENYDDALSASIYSPPMWHKGLSQVPYVQTEFQDYNLSDVDCAAHTSKK